jgi:molecular chaperone GrpE (heat shock protein)
MEVPVRDYRAELIALRQKTANIHGASALIPVGNALCELAEAIGRNSPHVERDLLTLRAECAAEVSFVRKNPAQGASYATIRIITVIDKMIALVDRYGIPSTVQPLPRPDTGRSSPSAPRTENGLSGTGQSSVLERQLEGALQELSRVKAELARVKADSEAYRRVLDEKLRLAQSKTATGHDERDAMSREATLRVEAEWKQKLAEEKNKLLEQLTAEQEHVRKLNAELGDAAARADELQTRCRAAEERAVNATAQYRALTDFEALAAALAADLASLPARLQAFARELLDIAGMLRNGDLTPFADPVGLSRLDVAVYSAPPAFAVSVSAEKSDALRAAYLRMVSLQGWIHKTLSDKGLTVISPESGAEFDPGKHACSMDSLVWINAEPERHNRVISVNRIGYALNGQVLRKAEVKRFEFRPGRAEAAPGPPAFQVRAVEQGVSMHAGDTTPVEEDHRPDAVDLQVMAELFGNSESDGLA